MIADQTAATRRPRNGCVPRPGIRAKHESSFRLGEPDRAPFDAVFLRRFGSGFSGGPLIDANQFDAVRGDRLRGGRHRLPGAAILFVRRSNPQSEPVTQRIGGDMHLGVFAPFSAVVAGSRAALRRGLRDAGPPASVAEAPRSAAAGRWATSARNSQPARDSARRGRLLAADSPAARRLPASTKERAHRTPAHHHLHRADRPAFRWHSNSKPQTLAKHTSKRLKRSRGRPEYC